jgi:hypothetical protein
VTLSRERPAPPGLPELCFAPPGEPPFAVDGRVVEDDTWLVLGADPRFRESAEHPIRAHTAAWDAEPARLGSVEVRAGRPLELRAIVHDLAQDPTWREEWVREALVETLREAERHRLQALELPVLGAAYGSMRLNPFLDLLRDALTAVEPRSLQRIWLHHRRRVAARPVDVDNGVGSAG